VRWSCPEPNARCPGGRDTRVIRAPNREQSCSGEHARVACCDPRPSESLALRAIQRKVACARLSAMLSTSVAFDESETAGAGGGSQGRSFSAGKCERGRSGHFDREANGLRSVTAHRANTLDFSSRGGDDLESKVTIRPVRERPGANAHVAAIHGSDHVDGHDFDHDRGRCSTGT
jgi:hypothetical protein